MTISAVVATAKNGVIGKNGGLPWYLPADLAHFKQVTMDHPVIMGRKTFESIGKALPGRQNIVITHDKSYQAEGCETAHSLEEALGLAGNTSEVFIIGGQAIYELAMPITNRVYLTIVDADVEGDKFFHYKPSEWRLVSSEKHQPDDKNKYSYEFVVLSRR